MALFPLSAVFIMPCERHKTDAQQNMNNLSEGRHGCVVSIFQVLFHYMTFFYTFYS